VIYFGYRLTELNLRHQIIDPLDLLGAALNNSTTQTKK